MDSRCLPQQPAPEFASDAARVDAFGACPTHWLICQLADRWTLPVLGTLQFSAKRFTELQEALHPISHRMLSRSLQKLVRIGLVTRTVIPSTPPQVRYEASALGRSLGPPLGRLMHWSAHNFDAAQNAGGVTQGSDRA
jgi:DNA-binding HxlR family transcriptional regulator